MGIVDERNNTKHDTLTFDMHRLKSLLPSFNIRKHRAAKKNFLFIVNPASGKKYRSRMAIELITRYIQKHVFDADIIFTRAKDHAAEIAVNANIEEYSAIVAVGGDGTISEIVQSLAGSDTTLGIMPTGSGNGLARDLGIPTNLHKALQLVIQNHSTTIDLIQIDEKIYSAVTVGMGFDARISELFAQGKKRGASTYFQVAIKEIQKYQLKNYRILADGQLIEREAFLITFANAQQYGSNCYIAPDARFDDGWMDLCILNKFPVFQAPQIFFDLFNKRIQTNKYYEMIRCKAATIEAPSDLQIHIDGDPFTSHAPLHLNLLPKQLRVIYNNNPTLLQSITSCFKTMRRAS